jgi:1A family penicillin-binding protein
VRPARPPVWILAAALLSAVAALGAGAVGVATAAVTAYQEVVRDLPSIYTLPDRPTFQTTEILDRHGTLLYEVFDQDAGKRTLVALGEMPQFLIDATIATEDAHFFTNPGVDARGILRAAWTNLEAGRTVAGGSTITQQLVKNVLIPPEERMEASLNRKIREAVLAYQISQTYTKEQILEMYLNEIYYGNLAYGVEAAAQAYFGKSVRDLTLAEAAMLAGLPQAPAIYDPFKDPTAAKGRQSDVLDLMVRHGFLDSEAAQAAKAEPLRYAPPSTSSLLAPHFVMYVRDVLLQHYGQRGLLDSGFRVYTTLDLETQRVAEEMVARHVPTLARQDARNAGLVAIDPANGEILALVGSPDYYNAGIDGQVNAAIADRQPGSAIKPIVYLAAFLRGFGPTTVVQDVRTQFPDGPGRTYSPENFDKRFRGPVTLRRALGNSLNVPAVKVLQFVGVSDVVRLARTLGVTSLAEDRRYGLSFTLGGTEMKLLELTGAYAALANGGRPVGAHAILRLEDRAGHVLYEAAPPPEPVLDPRLTFLLSDILADNEARRETFGLNSPLRLRRPAAVKTGSTDDYRDSWAIGYTPGLLAGVWVGNSDGRPMRFVLGSSGAGLIWHDFMERALEGVPAEPFTPPAGLVRGTVCAQTGYLAGGGCGPNVTDWFLAERPPVAANAPKPRVAINTRSNKLASAFCPLPEVAFRSFGGSPNGEGPYAPTEYCDLHNAQTGRPSLPWDSPPTATPSPTVPPRTPTAVSSQLPLGPTLAPLPTWTLTPVRTATATVTPIPTLTPGPSPGATGLQSLGVSLAVALPTSPPTPAAGAPAVSRQYHPWAHLSRDVQLSFPTREQPAEGVVPIIGSASLPYFERYALQYGDGEAPVGWKLIGAPRTEPVRSGVLDTWDTSDLPDGLYTLMLAVVDSDGRQQFARQVVRIRRGSPP